MSTTEQKYCDLLFTNHKDGKQTVKWESDPSLPFEVTKGIPQYKHFWTNLPFEIEKIGENDRSDIYKLKNPEEVQIGVDYPCSPFARRFEDLERNVARIMDHLGL